MRAVIQRVRNCSVEIDHATHASIGEGLLVLLGITDADDAEDIEWLAQKIINLRIFSDAQDMMNLSVQDISGEILVVSQFTLFAQVKKGNRPSFTLSSKPDIAIPLYKMFLHTLERIFNKEIKTGIFGADMEVHLINNGPVTIVIDTKNKL